MRNLIILRGAPGAGKSHWIKENNLEEFTLCADTIRLLFQSPMPGLNKNELKISQENDTDVWVTLFELLEKRMERGELVVIDATHSRRSDFSKYNGLCEKYRYRRYFVDFSDVPIDVCKEQNRKRIGYKQVPDRAIDKIYSRLETQEKTSGWVEIPKDKLWETIDVKCFNFDEYEKIHIFGDIHSCFEPLKEYFEKYPYSEKDFYIFCGDYLDRGYQAKEVLKFMIDFSAKPNVLCLAGNHEKYISAYANDEEIRSAEFRNNTIPQIIDIPKSNIRQFYRRLGQMAYFTYKDQKYFVCHGGIPYMPEHIVTFASQNMIHGVGSYEDDIDQIWSKNEPNTIQVHGHRNVFMLDNDKTSYNLEGKIEFEGDLRVLQISDDNNRNLIKIKNTYVHTNNPRPVNIDNRTMTEKLRDSVPDIRETKITDTISSFNFSRDVFYHNKWEGLTTHARGLFVDTEKDVPVARSYSKFFNVNQRKQDRILNLVNIFRGHKITAYKKENGYLGLISVIDGEFFIATKSSNAGDYATWFKNIWNNNTKINKDFVKIFLENKNATAVFEVIDPVNDPHIIEYDEPEIILLDVVRNDWEFYKEDFETLQEFAKEANLKCKKIYRTFENEREFFKWFLKKTDEYNLSDTNIEGVVIECETDTPNNPYMTKVKFPYYNLIKMHRGIKDRVARKNEINFASLWHPLSNYFYKWLLEKDRDYVGKTDIIALTKEFFKENPKHKEYLEYKGEEYDEN